MASPTLFFVGRPEEVDHHAAPVIEHAPHLEIRILEPVEVVEQSRPGDLAVFYSEHFDRFRECCQQLIKKNVATIYMIDGILEWRNAWVNRDDEVACPYTMRPVLSHKVACIGASQARVLNSWGNVGKTEVVGIPRLDSVGVTTPAEFGQRPGRSDNQFRVLVMTAKTPGFTPEQVATVKQSLSDLKNWLSENQTLNGKEVEFVWRLTGDLEAEIGVENSLMDLSGKELSSVLKDVDAVITTPSTAMLEAMKCDLPVSVLDYHNCPHYVTAGWDICGPEHISPTMKQLAERPEVRMMFQRDQLFDALHFGMGEEKATDRFLKLIELMLKTAAKQIVAGEPLAFADKILKPASEVNPGFSHRKLYPKVKEFENEDRELLQVELSHARREVKHLQSELAQLQSELEQAHQIFEQIEKHPIAGPIVRVRQKMLDLMMAIRNRKTKLDRTPPASTQNHSASQPETPLN